MKAFYDIINYLKEQLESDIDVNTVTHGTPEQLDNGNKKDIFPIAHIQVIDSILPSGLVVFTFDVGVLDQRNINKFQSTDKFLRNDNELDNLNTCHTVLARLISRLRTQLNDLDIELYNEPTIRPIIFEYANTLDGWFASIQLSIPNRIPLC